MIRIQRLQKWLEQNNLEAFCVDDPTDLLYLTGMTLSLGRCLITQKKACLFVDGRYFEAAKQIQACNVSLLSNQSISSFLGNLQRIGFDSAFTTVEEEKRLQKELGQYTWVPIPKPLSTFRMVKDPEEIVALREAAQLTWKGYQWIVSLLKEGVSELELALEFELFCKKQGATSLSFSPIIAFGENSAYPHYRAGHTKLQQNQLVLMDLGAAVKEYKGDMTRILFFGTPNPTLSHYATVVARAKQKAIEAIRPHIRFGELDRIAREELDKEGLGSLFTHGLSHGIGLETHEFPSLKIKGGHPDLLLEPGMVFTVEPGVYQPGLGGIRLEDTVLVTPTGYENFFPQTQLYSIHAHV